MRADTLRYALIGILAVAAIVAPFGNSLAFVLFVCAIPLFLAWRRAAVRERAARVFDRESKTDETGTRTDR